MSKNNKANTNMGKTKRSTDDLIDSAIAQQNDWMENRRNFARRFLKTLNIFARPNPKNDTQSVATSEIVQPQRRSGLASYWFPILCAVIVVLIAVWVVLNTRCLCSISSE